MCDDLCVYFYLLSLEMELEWTQPLTLDMIRFHILCDDLCMTIYKEFVSILLG
jgi:hypothetical protein